MEGVPVSVSYEVLEIAKEELRSVHAKGLKTDLFTRDALMKVVFAVVVISGKKISGLARFIVKFIRLFKLVSDAQRYVKTKELILYIANKLDSKDNYGGTLLNKALYFIDNVNYLRTGSPISDFTYVKQEFGPTPEPSQWLAIKQMLLESGEAIVKEQNYFGRVQKRLIATRDADISHFSSEEIDLINEIISSIGDWTAVQASDYSHQYPAWLAAEDRERLPFYTFLLSAKPPSDKDIEWAKAELKRVQDQ
jgi:hypothetical protein